jgi:hypothetical protein
MGCRFLTMYSNTAISAAHFYNAIINLEIFKPIFSIFEKS